MTTMRLPLLPALLLITSAQAQYQGPESVEYDPVGDRYLVSNTQSSSIKARDQAGVVTDLVTGLPNAPYGLEIMGDVLYACMGNGVRGFSLATGQQVYVRNLGASFPNGITTDGTHLYITDFASGARRIYKVDPVADSHVTLVASTGQQPNGIVWDPEGERLVVVFWGSNAPIKSYDRITGAETVLVANTGVGNIDGVTIDCNGDFLIASWSPARITRYASTFAGGGTNLNVPGLNNPADIDFDEVHQRVCIPNTGSNTVVLFDISAQCLPTSVDVTDHVSIQVWPSPTSGPLWIQGLPTGEPFTLHDVLGAKVLSGNIMPGNTLDLAALPTGLYYLHLPLRASIRRVVKE